MRGKRDVPRGQVEALGRIPAHAGKTTSARRVSRSPRAHPRSRGENPTFAAIVSKAAGSSPLTRGKPFRALLIRPRFRLIPAHAGKTQRHRFLPCRRAAPPHTRGENDKYWDAVGKSDGSSPLTQGKRCMILPTGRPVRLIPAHAGKTESRFGRRRRLAAHPRSRGENSQLLVSDAVRRGSSPLMRGKHVRSDVDVVAAGLIPAHAGKTEQAVPASRERLIPAHAGKTR